jgi:UDP-N-acetylmuramoyl-L-alanyl-D-glutamate--2,6-diaminopimelate ligase
MKLKDILLSCKHDFVVIGNENIDVTDVSCDSRMIGKNCAFFALPGHITNGAMYINEVIDKGASVIIATKKHNISTVVQILVDDIFNFMAVFCAKFYNYPDRELNIIGVTGTNGKTTITYIIENILANVGIECGVIGTINYRYAKKIIEAINTTPQSLDIYKIMRNMVNCNIRHLVMEVSSHALSLGRVYGIDFDIAVFTNLTQDHLDFHKTMDNYFKSKSILFRNLGTGTKKNQKYAIVNVDDTYGEKLSSIKINAIQKFYSVVKPNSDFQAENIEISTNGSKFDLVYNKKSIRIGINYVGMYNVYNALGALGAVVCSGISFEKAVEGLSNLTSTPGRLEKIDVGSLDFSVFVDYAHTSDALKNVLQTFKNLKPKRVITVFGCGGDRDRTKRPLIGKIAVEMSDFVFVTSDNPRTEDPNKIILDIEVGIKRIYKNNYKVIVDRELAIKEAIMMATKGDIVLLAGKGHESYQVIGTKKIHFSDIEIAKKYISLKEQKKNQKGIEQKEFAF